LILSSPAAEGITAFVVPTPLRKIPGAWAERARVKPLACLNSEIFPPEFLQISQSKVMQEPAHLTVCGLLNRGYSDRTELSLFSWL